MRAGFSLSLPRGQNKWSNLPVLVARRQRPLSLVANVSLPEWPICRLSFALGSALVVPSLGGTQLTSHMCARLKKASAAASLVILHDPWRHVFDDR
jgi:hypothetical protein